MQASIELTILIAALLLLLAVFTSKVSNRFGIPALLLFLLIGMLAGSDGPGGIYFDNPWIAQFLGTAALAYILFAGGLATNLSRVRPVLPAALSLSTIGVAVTALSVGAFAHFALGFTWLEGLLLGAIISSTDAAAVFSILRSRATRLRGDLEPLLELESGSNDPMAVFLTIGLTQLLANPDTSPLSLIPFFLLQFGLGGLLGWLLGQLAVRLINRLNLAEDGLYPVLTTTIVLLVYGSTAALGGNGFLAVYLAGIILGNHQIIHKRSLTHYHDGLAWLMQIIMFLVLGLQVFPSRLLPVAGLGLLVAGFLILIARPLGVFLALLPFKFSPPELATLGWIGLRGAAPIVLATFPLLAGLPESEILFHLVFFVVLVSVLLQGSTVAWVAARLGMNLASNPSPGTVPLQEDFTERHGGELVEIAIPAGAAVDGKRIVDLPLPDSLLIVLIQRADAYIIPRGSITLHSGDRILVAADAAGLAAARQLFTATSA